MSRATNVVVVLLLLMPLSAIASFDSFILSTAEIAYQGPEPITLLVVPDGSGSPFTAAQILGSSSPVDGTLTFYLRTDDGLPVSSYPSEDLRVNLSDTATFATDFFGPYNFRADFHRDGQINLSDLVAMRQAVGAVCP